MKWLDALRARLRLLFLRGAAESRMDEEFRFHLDMATQANVRAGMTESEARRRALVQFGGVDRHAEAMRDGRGGRWLDDLVSDARYAVRTLRKTPAFTAAAVVTLALGIGVTTSIFGVVDALFLRHPAGVRHAGDIVRLYVVRDSGMIQTPQGGAGSYVDYRAIRADAPAFSRVAAFESPQDFDLGRGADAQRIRGRMVSQTFLPLLGVGMARGRWFLPEEDSAIGAHPVAVISHGFWQRQLGGDPGVIGRALLVNGTLLTVAGVTEAGFTGIGATPVEIWIPFAMEPALGLKEEGSRDWRDNPMMIGVSVIGRFAAGVPHEVAVSQAQAALRHAAEAYPELDQTPEVLAERLVPAGHPHRSQGENLSLWLLAATALVLLIACANVASLTLSRAITRQRDTAVRSSLGAARGRLFRQHLTESMILALLGGALGLGLAFWGSRVTRYFALPPSAGNLDMPVLAVAVGLTFGIGVIFGVVPAWHAGGVDPADGLKQGFAWRRRRQGRLRHSLVAFQVAMTAMLLVGAVLFLRSLGHVYAVDPGVDTDRILVAYANLDNAGYELPERESLYREAEQRVLRVPGVERVSLAQFPPFSENRYGGFFRVPGQPSLNIKTANMNWVGPDYFTTVGTQILQGRAMTDQDERGSEPVAMVNENLAAVLRRFGDVVGMCITVREQELSGGCTRIVGVAANQRFDYLDAGVDPAIYLAHAQDPQALPWEGTRLVIRTSVDPSRVADEVRSVLQNLRPDLPYVSVQPLEQRIRPVVLPYRLGATLFTLFAVLALTLAAVGLYGMLGYFIAERRPELGIRKSLGADGRDVVRLVVGQGMRPVLVGLVLGLGAAYAGVRLLQAMLFGVTGRDPATFLLVAGFLSVVALAASYIPARRAANVDPMIALRAE